MNGWMPAGLWIPGRRMDERVLSAIHSSASSFGVLAAKQSDIPSSSIPVAQRSTCSSPADLLDEEFF